MPEHLKNAANTKEFEKYIKNFIKRKESQHRKKVLKEAATSLTLMLAG